ncbi:RNA 3'-terminal phosphate cyclase [Halospeciosus flavus]|uniref:RNA 3'-terminal phosphate cyclase n=1 Tax=Halospeciosus flavus TaxID=3032283 RepID=A0ABD5Z447_9EURY|nr:RNA 3'-terminal phosphate cyclase [Halospeciosus flavus]
MIELDGSGGGGQLVRTALGLSALTGEAFEMENVRGARSNAGLRHQHVAATRAVAAVCDADVEGDEVGSETVRFEPGPVNAGDVEVTVGTAGNLTLVFDALLPVAYALDDTLTVAVEEAGTDVPHAPPIDYQRHAKLPLLREYGVDATVDVDKRGFYPDGGGAATLTLDPSDATALDLSSRDSIKRLAVYSVATTELRAAEVAHRQAAHVENALDLDVEIEANADYVGAPSAGSVLVVVAEYEHSRAGFARLGERGTPSESVADSVVQDFRDFRRSGAAVDANLGDQLLPFLAVAGGEVAVPEATDHVDTCLDVLDAFGYPVAVEERADHVLLSRTE